MNKLQFMRLWDSYSGLLTPTQREITNLYFNYDLTVSEIADQKQISRQAVSECLAGCKKQLDEYEKKLKFVDSNIKIGLQKSFMLSDITRWAENFKLAHPEFRGEIENLINIVNKDYSAAAGEELAKPGVQTVVEGYISADGGENE